MKVAPEGTVVLAVPAIQWKDWTPSIEPYANMAAAN